MNKPQERSIQSAVAVNLIRTLTLTLLSFISFPFTARALGATGMGNYTYANKFVYYFLILAKLGIPNLAVRECAKVRDDQVALSRKAQGFFIMQLVTTLLSFGVMCIFLFSLPGIFTEAWFRAVVFLLSINFLVGAFSFEWFYIALEKHFYIGLRSVLVATIGTLLVIGLVKSSRHLHLYAVLAISGTLITSTLNVLMLKRNGFIFKPLGNYEFKQYLRPVFSIALITLMITIYNQTDTMILGALDTSQSSTGSYSVGIKVVEIVITVLTSMSAIFLPRATKLIADDNIGEFKKLTAYSNNLTLLIGLPAVGLIIVLAPEIISYIVTSSSGYWGPNDVNNARIALMIVATMMLTYPLAENIYHQVLLPIGKERIYLICLTTGVIVNISGALLLGGVAFKDNPIIGIALSTLISDIVVLVPLLIYTRKLTSRAIFNFNSLKIILAAVAVSLFAYFITPLFNMSSFLKVVVVGGVSLIIYVTILLISKENIVRSIIPLGINKGENNHE